MSGRPLYLSRVPEDPFSGRPLIYRPQGLTGLLYSVGLDQVDDGGKPAGRGLAPKGELLFDSDWGTSKDRVLDYNRQPGSAPSDLLVSISREYCSACLSVCLIGIASWPDCQTLKPEFCFLFLELLRHRRGNLPTGCGRFSF